MNKIDETLAGPPAAGMREALTTIIKQIQHDAKNGNNHTDISVMYERLTGIEAMAASALKTISAAPDQTAGGAVRWPSETHRLFGYFLGCANNHREVAAALEKIDLLLKNGCDVKIDVADAAAPPGLDPVTLEAAAKVADNFHDDGTGLVSRQIARDIRALASGEKRS